MGAALAVFRARGINPFDTGLGGAVMINLLITFTLPGISVGGHVGGLIGGFIAGWILTPLGPRVLKDPNVALRLVVLLGAVDAVPGIAIARTTPSRSAAVPVPPELATHPPKQAISHQPPHH